MGSRANVVVLSGGRRRVYYSHGAAQFMDSLAIWGPSHLLYVIKEWESGSAADPDGEPWLDNVWAEGGCCVDLDKRHLLIFGGEGICCGLLWRETYDKMLRYTWPGWRVEWAQGGLGQIARYAGVTGDLLERIDCHASDLSDDWAEEQIIQYIGYLFDIGERGEHVSSTLTYKKGGKTTSSFLSETAPENLFRIGPRIEAVIDSLSATELIYDDGEALMGGLYLDADEREAWLWRTWDTEADIELPEYWDGWTLHDLRQDYRSYFRKAPRFIRFAPHSELDYVNRIGSCALDTFREHEPWDISPKGARTIWKRAVKGYLADNPEPVLLPALDPSLLAEPELGNSSAITPDTQIREPSEVMGRAKGEDAAAGLPAPRAYDNSYGDLYFNALDYGGAEYAGLDLDQKIRLRGHEAFVEQATPDDFAADEPSGMRKVGKAELRGDSTWGVMASMDADRDVEREANFAEISRGDLLQVAPCSGERGDGGYAFRRNNGEVVPGLQPYHYYDDVFFEEQLEQLKEGEELLCRVDSADVFGGEESRDPGFNWRVYAFKVTVMKKLGD